MFGFLKKKLKEAVEKISGVAKEEPSAEEIEKAETKAETINELEEETKEKEMLAEESGFEMTPEIKEAIEKPAERILRGHEPERTAEEIIGKKETEEVSEETEAFEEKTETPFHAKDEKSEAEKAYEEKNEELIERKIETEKDVSQKKKSLLEKFGMRKSKKEKGETAKPEPEPIKPEMELPPDFEIAGEAEKKEEKEKTTFFKKIRKAISEKTLEETDIKDILWDLQIGLIENDVAVGAAEKISADLKKALVGKSMPKKGIEEAVKDSMKKSIIEILDAGELSLEEKIKAKKPFLAVFLGFNGVGKTTTIARVGHLLKKKGFNCIFAAADTWRAGAIQQIEEHGNRLGIKVIRQEYGSDPAAIIFDAKKYAESHGIDVILADTAGRSHTNVNLVDELKKIVRVNKPDLKVLVIDALTGNDVVEQTRYFNEAVGADAMIITKADVYEKGGSILSAAHTIKKPIIYLGVGQGYGDLEEFDVEKVVDNLLE